MISQVHSPRQRSADIHAELTTACTVNMSSTPAHARPGHANLGQKSCGVQAEQQQRNSRKGFRFSVQIRSAGASCGAGCAYAVWEVIHWQERAHGEVVCRVSILPSDTQDMLESVFCSAFHQSLILGSSPINQLGWGRKRTETTQHLACANSRSRPELRP